MVETGDALCAHDSQPWWLLRKWHLPYMAHDCIRGLAARGDLDVSAEEGIANYNRAVTAGIVSIMSKMGISTVQSYHSAQIFEPWA